MQNTYDFISSRNAEIVNLRNSGLTLKSAGQKFGLSGASVFTIMAKHKRKKEVSKTIFDSLSTGLRNSLLRSKLCKTKKDVIALIESGEIKKLHCIGSVRIEEVTKWAYSDAA